MDLLSLVLTLQPLKPPENHTEAPRWWGRAAHALLLNTIRQQNDVLAEGLHEPQPAAGTDGETPNTLRPFTASTLIGRFQQGAPIATEAYILRLTAFQEQLTTLLWNACREGGPLAVGQAVELDYLPFRIQSIEPALTPRPPLPSLGEGGRQPIHPYPLSQVWERGVGGEGVSPWAAATSYQELSAPYLLAKIPAPRRISMQFTSPTTFKSGGKHVPVPLPELVFGSLLDKWNAYAPIAFPPEVKRYAVECLAISQYKLSSRPVPQKSGGVRMGAVGEITYAALHYDRYWMSVIATLAAFALFSGVGAGTSQGLGQARAIVD